jgi:hypothetical protein
MGSTPMLSSLFTKEFPEILISKLPLEIISRVTLQGRTTAILQNLSRFKKLSSLSLLEGSISESNFLPNRCDLPLLEHLVLHGFKEIDISNLVKLKELNIRW